MKVEIAGATRCVATFTVSRLYMALRPGQTQHNQKFKAKTCPVPRNVVPTGPALCGCSAALRAVASDPRHVWNSQLC